MNRVSMFTHDIVVERDSGLVFAQPGLKAYLTRLEWDVRNRVAPGAQPKSANILLEDELAPVLCYFLQGVSTAAGVPVEAVTCTRSWCFVARQNEYVFFDREQWWRHEQPSSETGLHNHLPFHFTGVLYVDIADTANQTLAFLNPTQSAFGRQDWFHFAPKTDTFLIFESYLWHRVPYHPEVSEQRMVLSMDALVSS
jgi:hypothetical protein